MTSSLFVDDLRNESFSTWRTTTKQSRWLMNIRKLRPAFINSYRTSDVETGWRSQQSWTFLLRAWGAIISAENNTNTVCVGPLFGHKQPLQIYSAGLRCLIHGWVFVHIPWFDHFWPIQWHCSLWCLCTKVQIEVFTLVGTCKVMVLIYTDEGINWWNTEVDKLSNNVQVVKVMRLYYCCVYLLFHDISYQFIL